MTTRERALAYREQGWTYAKIAEEIGVSKQRVAQICGRQDTRYFRIVGERATASTQVSETG